MDTLILDGVSIAQRVEQQLSERIKAFKDRNPSIEPALATILVGGDPASATYVRMKQNACRRIGMNSITVELPDDTTTDQLRGKIRELNANPNCFGILLQHPVPAQIDERACFDEIDLQKDVDGVTCLGFGRMAMQESAFGSATPQGIMRLLEAYDIDLAGKNAVVVGRSPILGKPMALMLLNADATVTVCHSRTQGLADIVGKADIVVGAVGKPEFIQAEWIKEGAIVIDAGYHPGGIGDIELGPLMGRAAALTPVPGGVGPMTINTLIQQCVDSVEQSEKAPLSHN